VDLLVDDLESSYLSLSKTGTSSSIWVGIHLESLQDGQVSYSLRFANDYGTFPDTSSTLPALWEAIPTTDQAKQWVDSGFLSLQHAVDCIAGHIAQPDISCAVGEAQTEPLIPS